MTLDKVKKGQVVKITGIPNEMVRVQAIRFGISEGTVVVCREVVPAGPVVVARNKQEIAIGRSLARTILVEPC
ncbi:MAG: ferrous iron transport protein A [Pelotomaculum sp.]|uniref:Fe2+ transport system protein A n=1 Tax=Pelotomaculum thermopropionicum (strain DSM 13744 / JCM 10971 / SI) TaxID=370438 RepID=A5D122_PELTS|nr:ferrous iron transport protein A [Pelotomaculum sp.]BAF60059.1 Fe2+ transport system protein A [Pelotomaculum thermopropionicum SI]